MSDGQSSPALLLHAKASRCSLASSSRHGRWLSTVICRQEQNLTDVIVRTEKEAAVVRSRARSETAGLYRPSGASAHLVPTAMLVELERVGSLLRMVVADNEVQQQAWSQGHCG